MQEEAGAAGGQSVCCGCCAYTSRNNALDFLTKLPRMRSTTARQSATSSALTWREAAPDATTLLKCRRLLEEKELTTSIFTTINAGLAEKDLLMRAGTIIDTTLIATPPSTKNQGGERDPDMHQAKKGNQWHFGMKAHIGADAESRLVHAVIGTEANVNDVTQAQGLCMARKRTSLATRAITG